MIPALGTGSREVVYCVAGLLMQLYTVEAETGMVVDSGSPVSGYDANPQTGDKCVAETSALDETGDDSGMLLEVESLARIGEYAHSDSE